MVKPEAIQIQYVVVIIVVAQSVPLFIGLGAWCLALGRQARLSCKRHARLVAYT